VRKLFSVALISGALTLLRMVSGFVIAKVVAVYTGPSGIAMLGQVQAMVAALGGILTSPAGTGIVRFTSEHHAQGHDACAPWWRAGMRWLIGLTLVIVPVTCLFAEPIAVWTLKDAGLAWVVVVCALGLPLAAANTLIASVLNGQQRYRQYVGLGMLSVLIATLAMLWMVQAHRLEGALLAAAVFSGISGLVMWICVITAPWARAQYWFGRVDTSQMKDIGGYVLMAVATAVTIPTALVLVRNTLVDTLGWEQAGLWQAVYRISEVYLALITISFSTYYLPRLSQLKGYDAIIGEVHRVARIVLPVAIVLASLVYLMRDVAIQILFDERFMPARDLFAVQLSGDVFKILTWLYAYPMLSSGAKYWFIATEVIFALAFVGLSKVLVSSHGLDGANAAYSLSYAICFIFVITNSRRFMR
jgi:O-antigen/teichoic acid export membrane protein